MEKNIVTQAHWCSRRLGHAYFGFCPGDSPDALTFLRKFLRSAEAMSNSLPLPALITGQNEETNKQTNKQTNKRKTAEKARRWTYFAASN